MISNQDNRIYQKIIVKIANYS